MAYAVYSLFCVLCDVVLSLRSRAGFFSLSHTLTGDSGVHTPYTTEKAKRREAREINGGAARPRAGPGIALYLKPVVDTLLLCAQHARLPMYSQPLRRGLSDLCGQPGASQIIPPHVTSPLSHLE